ncbi:MULTISPECIES: head maturation protease, ClpP-related [unclassified Bradyrhizobium]|uniref:head maturation protease, ClpP-related n=1 Tax=unclassified Bradyrhizobium TaxID=2631580 RepID=UPI001BA9882D|nr:MULTISPECIES: head maturation protease, ClpP-related [unclassified Bradyrhizobium]MBR1206969.1 Clp protease ClpP [Bradyrhizobium sp. AUGA SZCCT0124]MBR1313508.1 Clp protease ClpP [Bradyrhizobium sp. AUGA SZCCT0051]MBR1343395.1 Clp protease ClpP [Bradyrhizobium sp. AUGA SZCCT0105]MBR1357185.1 Clp protease ClpP [Bradyrhizobium sp. AUGA SZCCT0045]
MKPRNRLFNLLSANAKRGSFRADASTNSIELYDVICSSDEEASWFGGVSMEAFARALRGMTGTVHLRINSPGGDVFAGVAMAQYMREYSGEIIAHVDGYAASIASIIAIAADKVVMAPGSLMMIHQASTFSYGNAGDFLATAELLEKVDGQIAERYTARANGRASQAEFADMMAAETWFAPQEAIDAGLCDEIAPEKEKASTEARSRWDVSAYKHAPAPPAKQPDAAEVAAAQAAAVAAAVAESEHAQRRRLMQLLVTAA